MPDLPLLHANERVDRIDLNAIIGFPRELDNLLTKYRFLDRQSRIMRGFRIELPDQNTYPGRVIIHGGFGHQYDGQHVFNEDQLNVSRTITLEGSSTTFYLEVEFLESESDVDARAFWDATVDQGYDISGDAKPDGQEFSANVSTRKTPDWQVITPVSTTGFTRDAPAVIASNRIPLAILATDSANKISLTANTNLQTEKAASTMMLYLSTTQIVVKEPWLFRVGDTLSVTDSSGSSSTSITSMDLETGLLTIAAITAKTPGAIVRVTSSSSPDFIKEALSGRYQKIREGLAPPNHLIDWRDMMWQGDEAHGDILSRGHSTTTSRSDHNLQSLKDHVDMLAAQLQELKWGIMDPSVSMTDSSRVPPGIATSFPTAPRYFDRAGGVAGARAFTVTVGDGIGSFGDFNGTTQDVLQAAHDALPGLGGRIFIKRGVYTLSSDFNITNAGLVRIEAEEGTVFAIAGGAFHLQSTGSYFFKNLWFNYSSSLTGMLIDTSNPLELDFERVAFIDCSLDVDCQLPNETSFRQCRFWGLAGTTSARPLIRTLGNGGARISGTFSDCNINHWTALFISAGLIYCNPADDGLFFVNFVDCSFSQALLNGEMINCGTNPNIVQFDRCYFSSLLTPVHIRVIGGTNIKSYNCVGTDAFAGHIHGADTTHILVDGYRNGNSTGFAFVDLADCSDVTVQNCDVVSNWGTSLTGASVKLQATAGNTVRKLSIRDNTFQSDTTAGINQTTGVIIITEGEEIHDISIERNTFKDYQAAIYIYSSAIGGEIFGTKINDNRINGQTVSGGTADGKIGIYIPGDDSTLRIWGIDIQNNTIYNLNSSAGYITGSIPRCGIYLNGAREPNISGNTIRGLQSNLNAGGIFASGWNGVVNDNVIRQIIGAGSALFEGTVIGIRVGSAIDPENWTVNGNTIEYVLTNGTQPTYQYGIQWIGDAIGLTINGNTIRNVFNANGGSGTQGNAFIGNPVAPASSYAYDVTISNNTCGQDSFAAPILAVQSLVEVAATTVRNLIITGNSVFQNDNSGNAGRGIRVTVGAGSARGVRIDGNIINGHATAEAIKCSCASLGYGLSICNNQIYANSLGTLANTQILVTSAWSQATINNNYCNGLQIGTSKFNIQISNSTFFTCTGNTCHLLGTTTVPNIEVDGVSDCYVIANNNCTTAGLVGTVASIRTTNATSGTGGLVEANVVDVAVSVKGSDTTVDNKVI